MLRSSYPKRHEIHAATIERVDLDEYAAETPVRKKLEVIQIRGRQFGELAAWLESKTEDVER